MVTNLVIVIAACGAALTLWDLTRSPIIRRIATRSIVRRPAEAALIIVGSMFGTAIIGAAFVVGDSFDGSIRDIARRELGPVDVVVTLRPTVETPPEGSELEAFVREAKLDHVDGLLGSVSSAVVLDNLQRGSSQKILPNNCVTELDFDRARQFGPDPAIGGLADAGPTPTVGQAVLSEETAQLLRVSTGDTIALHLYGQAIEQRVRQVVPTVGLGGFCSALVAPGTIQSAWGARAKSGSGTAAAQAEPPYAELLISLEGGVFDSTGPALEVEAELGRVLADSNWPKAEVSTAKLNRLDRAERQGENLRTIFSGVGGFSVISGILLLVNLVVMLAEERKVELGVLRAIGLKRRHLVRSFSLEGSLYAAASAALGALVAVGIGALVIVGTQKIFADPNRRFQTSLFVKPSTLLLAAGVGYSISMLTIWSASARISRLNIISAVRDLPDPRTQGRRLGALVGGTVGVVGGTALSVFGLSAEAQIPLLAGVPLAAFAMIGLTGRFLPKAAASVMWSVIAIAWILGVFTVFAEIMEHAGIGVFVAMGVLLVAAAVLMAVAVAPYPARWVARLPGSWGLAGRLGFAYPLAKSARTGLLLAMFSLVIFTMTFMASLAATIDDQATSGAKQVSAGYDLLIESSPVNPISAEELTARPEVAEVAMFTRAGPEFTIRYQREFARWAVSGFDESLLRYGVPKLTDRGATYSTDRAAFEAVLADPSLILVDDQFLLRGGGPKSDGPKAGDRVQMRNAQGETRDLRVAGVLAADYAWHGSLWEREAVVQFLSPQIVQSKAFVRLTDSASAETAARSLSAEFATRGAEVSLFPAIVADRLDDTTSFMRLLEVYLAFGLLIGIAGLGVVMVRAARERRREIAMLRAMGVPSRVIYRSFLVEALFISSLGAAIGVTLALITAYQVVVNSSAFSLASETFTVPWWPILLIATVPVGASLLASLQPARSASRVRPAVALRMTE